MALKVWWVRVRGTAWDNRADLRTEGHVPEKNPPDEEIPKQVDNLKGHEGREDLVLHPPRHPHTFLGVPNPCVFAEHRGR